MWSKHNPRLQIIWDATSLAALQKCPRYYEYSILQGWRQPANEHLDFGGMFQEAVECFQKARLAGKTIPEATRMALLLALQVSGSYQQKWDGGNPGWFEWTPWGGQYVQRWRCTGTEPFMEDGKKSRKKCPHSHKGKWFDAADLLSTEWADHVCPSCNSPTEHATHYLPDHPSKNRETLIRMVAWFCDVQDEEKGLQPFAFDDGTPAIELQAVVPIGRKAPGPGGWRELSVDGINWEAYGEDYLAVINIDEINTWRGRHYITDNKTTKDPLNDRFFRQFAPHTQFDFYDLIGSIAYQDLDIAGNAVRGIQVTKTSGDIKTRWLTKSEGQREEAWKDLHWWLDLAERLAVDDYYPMNRASCRNCPFAAVCDMDPAFRQQSLEADFVRRQWHPIHRGRAVPQEEEE